MAKSGKRYHPSAKAGDSHKLTTGGSNEYTALLITSALCYSAHDVDVRALDGAGKTVLHTYLLRYNQKC